MTLSAAIIFKFNLKMTLCGHLLVFYVNKTYGFAVSLTYYKGQHILSMLEKATQIILNLFTVKQSRGTIFYRSFTANNGY